MARITSTFLLKVILHTYFPISFQEPPKKESIADVLLWAILVDRKELAEICWLRGEDHLCKNYNIDKMNLYTL